MADQSFGQSLVTTLLGGATEREALDLGKTELASRLSNAPLKFQIHLDAGCTYCPGKTKVDDLCLAGQSAFKWDEAFRKKALS